MNINHYNSEHLMIDMHFFFVGQVNEHNPLAICSMYRIFTYIWDIYGINVARYSIHGLLMVISSDYIRNDLIGPCQVSLVHSVSYIVYGIVMYLLVNKYNY